MPNQGHRHPWPGTDMAMSGDLLAISDYEARCNTAVNPTVPAVMLHGGAWPRPEASDPPTPAARLFARGGPAIPCWRVQCKGACSSGGLAAVRSLQPLGISSTCTTLLWLSVALSGDRRGRPAFWQLAAWGPTRVRSITTNAPGGTGQWGLRGEYISSQAGYIDNFSISLALRGKVLWWGLWWQLRVVLRASRWQRLGSRAGPG